MAASGVGWSGWKILEMWGEWLVGGFLPFPAGCFLLEWRGYDA